MADFSSLGKGESLLANNKKNDSMACKKGGGDAAKIAGAAVAGVAVAGALAVGAAQSSLFSNGVGASGATQTAATNSINSASAGATSAASSAQSKATTAIAQGPGTEANANISSAQNDLKSAQTDASQTAGQTRAGVDAKMAEAAAAVKNAQNYIEEAKSAVTQTPTWLAGKVASAFAAAPPAATGLAPPSVGKLPTAPLPPNVPPPEKAVNQSVATPPSNLAIPPPAKASAPTSTIKSSTTTQQTVQNEQLKQTALSKEELDACGKRRSDITDFGLLVMADSLGATALEIERMGGESRKDFAGMSGATSRKVGGLFGSTIQYLGGRLLSQMIWTGMGTDFGNTKYFTSSEPKELRDKIEFGPLVGLDNFKKALELASSDVKYNIKCDELTPFVLITNQRVKLLDVLDTLTRACNLWIDTQNMKDITKFLQAAIPAWESINDIAYMLPNKYLQATGIKKGTSK